MSNHSTTHSEFAARASRGGKASAKTRREAMYMGALIRRLAKGTGLKHIVVEAVLRGYVAVVREELCKGRRVILPGFGSHGLAAQGTHEGHDWRTGERIELEGRWEPSFRYAKKYRREITERAQEHLGAPGEADGG